MDPRVARTRQALREAVFALVRQRPVEEISISDIAEEAGTNRSTFYQHYADKGELLADAVDVVAGDVLDAVTPDLDPTQALAVLTQFLEHVMDHAEFYHRVFDTAVAIRVQQRVRERLIGLFLQSDQIGQRTPTGLPAPIAAAAISGSAVAIIEAWLGDPEPAAPHEVAEWIWHVTHGASGIPEEVDKRL